MEKEIERMYMFVITLYTGQERISKETIASRMTKGKKKKIHQPDRDRDRDTNMIAGNCTQHRGDQDQIIMHQRTRGRGEKKRL